MALSAVLILPCLASVARAQTTTTTTTTAQGAAVEPSAAEQPAPDEAGDEPEETSAPTNERAKRLRLRLENVSPQKIFFKGSAPASFKYEIAGSVERDLVIEVTREGGGEVVQRWTERNVEPGATQTQTWGGNKRGKGTAKSGAYLFRVRERGGELADRRKADGDRSFGYYDHVFPIRGKHGYGDGIGAPRRGHRHQGVDVFAGCGTPLLAARAGKVQFKGFQGSGAGNYVVIDGKGTGRDYVYMHLKGKATVRENERVRTGQRIGEVGDSGSASGCHLHFELWSKPGWYQGGRFVDPMKKLKKWDRWS
jgi:murein DD-endopeptidase MepM/ murein hydrolase activator NlpD